MIDKIKVLHTEWSDGWGGQEIRIINEMIAVREQGVEVFLACRDNAKIKQKAEERNIKVFTLPFRGNLDFKTMFSLMKIIKENKIDIVNTHSGKDTWVGGIAAKLSGAKFIRTRHLSNRIRTSRFNFINELADYVFTTGESVRDDMINFNRINPNKIVSIPTGIDEKLFDPAKYNKNETREYFNIDENEIAIGIVAVLRDFKRHDIFFNIAKKLIKEYPDKKFKFLVAGDGPMKERLLSYIDKLDINNYVVMLGHTDKVPEFLSSLDLFILPSDKNEGVPQALIQTLMMEVSAVSTTAGSIADLYHNNNFLISEPKEEMIYKNIVKVIENTIKLDKDRAYVVDNFSKTSITKKIMNCYKEILR